MATTSFDKLFIIEDEKAIERLKYDLENPVEIPQIVEKKQNEENKQSLWLLEQFNFNT